MADSIIALLGASRSRVISGANALASGAVLGTPDTNVASQAIEAIYNEKESNPSFNLIDWVELAIAGQIDLGHTYPLGDDNAYRGAQWLAQMNILALPNPMPRDFVLYLAIASVAEGKSTSVRDTVLQLIKKYQFI